MWNWTTLLPTKECFLDNLLSDWAIIKPLKVLNDRRIKAAYSKAECMELNVVAQDDSSIERTVVGIIV